MAASQGLPYWKVQVYLYDISFGMARVLSPQFIGKQLEGIWHTGVVVYGYEHFYGGGIQAMRPGKTMAGEPMRKIDIGYTSIAPSDFHQYLHSISHRYTTATYSLLTHNCNNFSHEICKFLTGHDMPAYITNLPEEALNTPMGAMLRPMIMQMEQQVKGSGGGGMIPWGSGALDLPSQHSPPDGYGTPPVMSTASSTPASAPAVAAPVEQKQAAPVRPQTAAPRVATQDAVQSFTSQPEFKRDGNHAHDKLAISSLVSNKSKPLTSADTKYKSFSVLITASSKKQDASGKGLNESEKKTLDELVNALTNSTPIPPASYLLFDRILNEWSGDALFPVLGLFRLFVLRGEVGKHYETQELQTVTRLSELVLKPEANGKPVPHTAQSMALCSLANFFVHASFAAKLARHEPLVNAARHAITLHDQQTVRLMGATLLYNVVLALPKDDSDIVVELVSVFTDALTTETDAETASRLLLGLAHLVYGNGHSGLILSALEHDWNAVLKQFPTASPNTTTPEGKIHQLVSDIKLISEYEMEKAASGDEPTEDDARLYQ